MFFCCDVAILIHDYEAAARQQICLDPAWGFGVFVFFRLVFEFGGCLLRSRGGSGGGIGTICAFGGASQMTAWLVSVLRTLERKGGLWNEKVKACFFIARICFGGV